MDLQKIAQEAVKAASQAGTVNFNFTDIHDNDTVNVYTDGKVRTEGGARGQTADMPTLTDAQQQLFDKAEQAGLLERLADGYEWKKNPALLAYFLGRVFCGDKPKVGSEGKSIWDVSGEQMPVSALERLFDRTDFGAYRNKRQYSGLPRNHKLVDDLF